MWFITTVVAVVLLFSYRTSKGGSVGTAAAAETNDPITTGTGTTTSGSSSSTTSGGSRTYEGTLTQTRWGPIQVTITVSGGRIVGISVPVYPSGNGRDREINAYALPILNQEAIAAQNTNIDTVSGATVTSDGYRQSLQAAIDAAHLP
jgi:uncharacterized protein with FMN-binding domain